MSSDTVVVDSVPSDDKLVGIGIVFNEEANCLLVESLVPGSGAEACGDVLPGDELLTIDGKDVTGQKAAAIAKLVAGPVESTVVITLLRRSGQRSEKEGEGADAHDTDAATPDSEHEHEIKVVEITRTDFRCMVCDSSVEN